jgi:1,4-alpha-glucan branching enzyme
MKFRYWLSVVVWSIVALPLSMAQNAIVGTGFSTGWGGGSCPTGSTHFSYLNTSFGSSFGGVLTPNGSGDQYFRMGIAWDMTTAHRTVTIGSDVMITPGIEYTLNSTCTTSGAMRINVPSTSNRYVFKTRNGGTNPLGKFIVFGLSGTPSQINSVLPSPNTSIISPQAVTVHATLTGAMQGGQGAYLRYTTNNWTSSTILPMSGIGRLMTATIPTQAVGVTVQYYVFTSGAGLSISHDDADFYTINGNTNNGTNYTYSTAAASAVIFTPSNPTDNQSVTITFNAAGTALSGASKVYLHSGVSTVQGQPTQFSKVVGNWGQDDNVGLMTMMSPDVWQITMPSGMRSFYGVGSDKDIFGVNYLFRNANGTIKVDNAGKNYFNTANPIPYFLMTNPETATSTAQSGQNYTIQAQSIIPTTSWILKDTTTIPGTIVHTATGSSSFSYTFLYPDATTRKYKLTATYTAGVSKYKLFDLIGYQAATVAPRPAGMRLGVNYHADDPTKATLILHAPTYTRYKKGTGVVTGTNNTPPKNVVYAIGDFNNWTPSEAYKMYRDTDGWNGTTDADNDNDRGDYWWITLTGLTPGQSYVFQYLIDGVLQVADPYTSQVSDVEDVAIPSSIYPGLPSYPPQAQDRASVLKTAQNTFVFTAPSFIPPAREDLHIYEMLFRDFTEEGTYLAAINRLDYIAGLGINAIHVMPVSEFEGNSSWGYNPNFYFAADKAYGTADDLKKFIDECHRRKIWVFNDLVLNHAFYSNVMARMYWNTNLNRPADLNPWMNATHRMVRNTAGHWGADWNHESEHTQSMVDSVLGYWLHEFKFDGFRFDFTKGFGQTDPNDFPPGDDWASAYNQDRIDLLKRMVDRMWAVYPDRIAIFEHLAESSEDKVLADHAILMWSGVGHHNAIKNFILGYNADNPDIYSSGIYNAPGRNFAQPHWMSYPESHDEERLGFEHMNYFNGTRNVTTMIDRLKLAYAFNLAMPGPRMLWQFGEIGYDYSIDFNGRTGEKPVRWDYYDVSKRRELYSLISRIYKARSKYNLFSTIPDYGNIGIGSGNLTTPRVMRLSSSGGQHLIVVGNLDPTTSRNVTPSFDITGTWYRYNGAMDGLPYVVNSSNQNSTYSLQPSETVVFTSFAIDACTDVRSVADSGPQTLRDAISCAPTGGTVKIEFPIYADTIILLSPIMIDKNVTIDGFESQQIHISGEDLTMPIFEILAGKTVTLRGMQMTCSTGNHQGRCLLNNGILHLDNLTMDDTIGVGSTVINYGSMTITRSVNIK